jgi:hypothetical protein
LPLWLLLLIFLRDLMIVSGTVGSFMGNGESDNGKIMRKIDSAFGREERFIYLREK